VGQILKRRIGAQLHVDDGYMKLTSVTTYEDGEPSLRFPEACMHVTRLTSGGGPEYVS
jgi:hypothetical protein